MKDKIVEFFNCFGSIVIALCRLFFLTLSFITAGLHVVLFSRTEVCNAELKGLPWRCDRQKASENMAFIDSLYINNPEMFEPVDEQDLPSSDDLGDEGFEE